MNNIAKIVDSYLEAFNETDAAKRTQLVALAWASDGSFVDPLFEARGHAALADLGPEVAAKYPGHRFRRASGVDSHHGKVRFSWEFVGPDGKVVVVGYDYGVLAGDGRLQTITGFFGPLPEVAAA
jgi:hypothetical protein